MGGKEPLETRKLVQSAFFQAMKQDQKKALPTCPGKRSNTPNSARTASQGRSTWFHDLRPRMVQENKWVYLFRGPRKLGGLSLLVWVEHHEKGGPQRDIPKWAARLFWDLAPVFFGFWETNGTTVPPLWRSKIRNKQKPCWRRCNCDGGILWLMSNNCGF